MRPGYVAATVIGLLIVLVSWPAGKPVVVWNATESAPLGLYLVTGKQSFTRGELVVARLPERAARLAAQRAYLPLGDPVVKQVGAMSGDEVCSTNNAIAINGQRVALRLTADKEGRPLPSWRGCLRLHRDQVLLLTARVPDSFDGRYFGPTRRDAIIGKAIPLWTW
ncbi:MAG: S26 family signal peptidase [Pseudomonadota bacterium]|nr:S26 family signal peptidase [Pseudomonadota bacterium]